MLTKEGFKMFFSAVTLEERLGEEYEPYIFAALSTAQAMIAVGTRREYFDAVWVKNEWSRFLKLIKSGERRILIPVYSGMAYNELPEDFSSLQALDMARDDFMDILLKNIMRVVKPKAVKEAKAVQEKQETDGRLDSKLERAFIFLEDGEWDKADRYFEDVLDQSPKNGQAYLGKLMVEKRIKSVDDFANYPGTIEENSYFKKIISYGDELLVKRVEEYAEQCRKCLEYCSRDQIYKNLVTKMNSPDVNTEEEYINLSDEFKKISGNKDSDELSEQCMSKAYELKEQSLKAAYEEAKEKMQLINNGDALMEAKELFDKLSGYRDSDELAEECAVKVNELLESRAAEQYKSAVSLFETAEITQSREDMEKAERAFEALPKYYMDVAERIGICRIRAESYQYIEEKEEKYKKAQKLLKEAFPVENCVEAHRLFEEISGYKDSAEKAAECEEKALYVKKYNEDYERLKKQAEMDTL